MKAKKLLSVISLVLAFLIAFNSTAVAMDSAADYLNEVVLSNSEKTEEFSVSAPVMTDANGNYSENVSLSLSDDILTVTANKEG